MKIALLLTVLLLVGCRDTPPPGIEEAPTRGMGNGWIRMEVNGGHIYYTVDSRGPAVFVPGPHTSE